MNDTEEYTETVEELQDIVEKLIECRENLQEISRKLGYGSRAETILNSYVIPYLQGILGENNAIMMSLLDVIEDLQKYE